MKICYALMFCLSIFKNFVIKSIFIRFITTTFNAVHHQTQLFSAAVYSSPSSFVYHKLIPFNI